MSSDQNRAAWRIANIYAPSGVCWIWLRYAFVDIPPASISSGNVARAYRALAHIQNTTGPMVSGKSFGSD